MRAVRPWHGAAIKLTMGSMSGALGSAYVWLTAATVNPRYQHKKNDDPRGCVPAGGRA